MDLFPAIYEVPSAVIIERLVICLMISFLISRVGFNRYVFAVIVAFVLILGYLSLYFTWKTFVLTI